MATFTNQATLTYTGGAALSNIAVGELVEVLSATKTAVDDTYASGDNVPYVINILNSGTTPLTDLTVTDDLGGYTVGTTTVYPLAYEDGTMRYFVNGVLQPTPAVTAGPPLTVTGISVPAGGNAQLVFDTNLTGFAPLATDGAVTNTATVSGAGLTPALAQSVITAAPAADLTISKSLSPTTVTENGRLTYTFTVYNYGNTEATAADAVAIADTFDPALTDLAVAFNGTTWAEPTNYTYDAGTGAFATVPGQITVPAATYTQDPTTGVITTTPGISTLTVTGTV